MGNDVKGPATSPGNPIVPIGCPTRRLCVLFRGKKEGTWPKSAKRLKLLHPETPRCHHIPGVQISCSRRTNPIHQTGTCFHGKWHRVEVFSAVETNDKPSHNMCICPDHITKVCTEAGFDHEIETKHLIADSIHGFRQNPFLDHVRSVQRFACRALGAGLSSFILWTSWSD